MKLYIAIESMTLIGACNAWESENVGGQVKACLTRDNAVKAVRDFIHEQVECEHDGDPDYTQEDIDREAEEVFDQTDGTLPGDQWSYDATNRACVWCIQEQEV